MPNILGVLQIVIEIDGGSSSTHILDETQFDVGFPMPNLNSNFFFLQNWKRKKNLQENNFCCCIVEHLILHFSFFFVGKRFFLFPWITVEIKIPTLLKKK